MLPCICCCLILSEPCCVHVLVIAIQEVRNYPARLDLLEQIVGDARSELGVLHHMNEKAIKTSEESRVRMRN